MSRSLHFLYLLLVVAAARSELESLLEFKKGIRDDPLQKILPKWDPSSLSSRDSCPNSWPGVTCDSQTRSIVSIALDSLGLAGDLKFSTLLGLKSLQNLSLSGNSFTGRLVPAMGSMSSLQYLDLSANLFSGPIPAKISSLWNLKYLNLSSNQFSGWFPVVFPNSFRNLQQLRVLDLHGNRFSGDIASFVRELVNVEHLDVSGNTFGGGFGELRKGGLSGLTNTARYLNFSGNWLSGGFWVGDGLSEFQNLEVLDMSGCGANGQLPSFSSLQRLSVLRLGHNSLFGGVPNELLNGSVPLSELDLSLNGFTDSIPAISSSSLRSLNLSSNGFSGPLPVINGSCASLDLSSNELSGDISLMQQWLVAPVVLDLSSNNLSGNLMNISYQFSALRKVSFRNNSLEGTLPQILATSLLSEVDLSLNHFEGRIPSGFFTSSELIKLNLSHNNFNGSIPLEESHATELISIPSGPRIEVLDLSENRLSGKLPAELANLGLLSSVNLSGNDISGKIPGELSKLTLLEFLDLSRNNLDGTIPENLPESLTSLKLSYNDLSGEVPARLELRFNRTSFFPGNPRLVFPGASSPATAKPRHSPPETLTSKSKIGSRTVILIVASILLALSLISLMFIIPIVRRSVSGKMRSVSRPSFFKFYTDVHRDTTSLSFSNEQFVDTTASSGKLEADPEVDGSTSAAAGEIIAVACGRKSSPGSPLTASPRFCEPSVTLEVYSPDRLAGQLYFLENTLTFTAEELSRAPAEVLGRSSHGTLYKATLNNGHVLTVKWLRVGFVKPKREFAKEVKKTGYLSHRNIVSLRAYYWGPREQERLLLADYVEGDSLALHLYETTPRRYPLMTLTQRLKVAVDVAQCLLFLHERGLLHGNLKPSNILLEGAEYEVRLCDYGLHRMMTSAGVSEQMVNLGALGYRAPELGEMAKPVPTWKGDVYGFGVILMELLTGRSAGDIISGQTGAVDLADWVRMCDVEGRRGDCLADVEGPRQGMEELLGISLKCVLPVNERPNMKQVVDDLCKVSA